MSDAQEQVERVLAESEVPADGTQEDPLEADIPPDRTRQFTHTSFSRMRTGWIGDDQVKVMELEALATEMVRERFKVAFAVMERVRRSVRTPAADEDGVLLTYPDGTPLWEKDELGVPVEDWEKLSDHDRDALLFTITTHMFEWELAAAGQWADAMYSKGIWEEEFARGFTAIPAGVVAGKPTIDDRTQWGHKNAAEARYFALFQSSLSRKAEGIVRSMKSLQRLLENTAPR